MEHETEQRIIPAGTVVSIYGFTVTLRAPVAALGTPRSWDSIQAARGEAWQAALEGRDYREELLVGYSPRVGTPPEDIIL
jgi:hypothetical protein